MKQFTVIFLTLLMLAGAGVVIYKRIEFKQNCSGRLERAANANTVELAVKELDAAIKYAEDKGYTSGYTSVIYPDGLQFYPHNFLWGILRLIIRNAILVIYLVLKL